MKKSKKILMVILLIVLFMAMINVPICTKAAYTADKTLSTIKTGDVIYFDVTGLDGWNNVQIYIW